MAEDTQKILDEILDNLKSSESARQLEGIHALEQMTYGSKLIFFELEHLAIRGSEEVREAALGALSSKPNQYIASQLSRLSKYDRLTVLKEIEAWEENGLIEPHQAEVLSGRYDFETKTRVPSKPVAPTIPEEQPARPVELVPAGPRPSLMQTLLSEASIKVYLYLGAFFVIASALILAAVVEAARLPILAVATLSFGGVALGIHKRLPQPSFAFFIVFSFLLPIDANVIKESIGFVEPFLSVYWTVIFLLMAAIWSFSVWFYESRFFSAVAFVSLSLAFYRAGATFRAEAELQVFLVMLAALTGLGGTFLLRKWKDSKFSLFVFLLAQLQVLGVLFASLLFVAIHTFDSDISHGWWILIALTWLTAASFYALSNLLTPTFFFPWMAVAALLPLPWFILHTFDATQPGYAFAFWVWGAVFGLVSEIAFRLPVERIKKYHWAFLAGSLPLFLTAFSIALIWDKPVLTFGIFGLTAFLYASLHLVHPRWYVWSAALLSGLFAYFIFFTLPIIERLEVPFVYQLLIGSVLLGVPELFTRTPLSLKTESRWPAIALGILVSVFGLTLALSDVEHTGRGALVLIIYAILITLHAWHGKRAWLGYFATAFESLAIVFALDHFHLDLWLPALTLLSLLYYATGFFFRRRADELKVWGHVLINSGLILGGVLSITSLALFKESSGWYVILIALLFAVEIFARPLAWIEVAVEVLLSISLYLILDDFNVTQIGHFLFGASFIWLGGDLIFGYFIHEKRIHEPITLAVGYLLVLSSTLLLWDAVKPGLLTIYLALYALFFALSAFLKKEPRLGYLATAYLALVIIKFCDVINYEKQIFPLIALAVLYYASGYWLRRGQNANGWDKTLLYSGLALGVLTSLGAPFQGGLEASIPVAITATLFAAEAFALRNVWWALPANAFYLMSYFMILFELNVDEPQYFSIGAALLGMLMHYLLTQAGSKTGAFIAGMLSQLVLLGTTYIQMVSTNKLSFFFVLFTQSMIVLIYGLIQRSRSLVLTPIVFAVLGVMTVIYSALKGLGPVILIGSTGVLLLMAGIIAVLLRERITRLGEQLSEWRP
jgi:hypothetical protein